MVGAASASGAPGSGPRRSARVGEEGRLDALRGLRVLVVEDEALLALELEDMLADLGAEVVGPATTLEEGLVLAAADVADAAVLDLNLNGLRSFPIAERLRARRSPFIFATGYALDADAASLDEPVVEKPYDRRKIGAALAAALSRRA